MKNKKPTRSQTDSPHGDITSHVGHRARLKERLLREGTTGLSDADVVELLLAYAIPRRDVSLPALALLAKFGSLRAVLGASVVDLVAVSGISVHTAALLRLVGELSSRRAEALAAAGDILKDDREIARYLLDRMSGMKEEKFLLIFLDHQGLVLGQDLVGTGTVNQAVVFPRKVVEKSLQHNASALLIVHNHPHGPPLPSIRDREEAERIRDILRPFDITVKDSIIVGHNRCFSIFKNGPLDA